MAHRIFRADDGRDWQVWDTVPEGRAAVSRGLDGGWLSFEAMLPPGPRRRLEDAYPERRRVVPIPPAWESASVDALRALWRRAERVVTRAAQAAATSASQTWRGQHAERRHSTGAFGVYDGPEPTR